MARVSHLLTSLVLNALWAARPHAVQHAQLLPADVLHPHQPNHDAEESTLRSLIRRFPFWKKGRSMLSHLSLAHNDLATAYAEAQALRALCRKGTPLHTTSLFLLGRCHLKTGDSASALAFLNQAQAQAPHSYQIQEERAAAHVLSGERTEALSLLKAIPQSQLSAEGRAAFHWLSSAATEVPSQRKD